MYPLKIKDNKKIIIDVNKNMGEKIQGSLDKLIVLCKFFDYTDIMVDVLNNYEVNIFISNDWKDYICFNITTGESFFSHYTLYYNEKEYENSIQDINNLPFLLNEIESIIKT